MLGAGELFTEKVEVFVHELGRQQWRGSVHQMPFQVSLPMLEWMRVDGSIHALHKIGLAHVQALRGRRPHCGEVRRPVKVGAERLQLLHRHLVINTIGITAVSPRHRDLRQVRLDGHHRFSICRSFLWRFTHQREHVLDVLDLDRAVEHQLGVGAAEAVLLGQERLVVPGGEALELRPRLPPGRERTGMAGSLVRS